MDAQSWKFSDMPENADEAVSTPQNENSKYSKQKILIVDDDEVTLEIMKVYLKKFYAVTAVSSGELALEYLSAHSVNLILLDYMMPDMDGPTVFKRIRCEFPTPYIPIVFLTGVSDKELVIKGLQLHPTDYLLKPVEQATLLERVHKVLL